MEEVSLFISELATIQFSVTISESTGTVCDAQSRHQVWKPFR